MKTEKYIWKRKQNFLPDQFIEMMCLLFNTLNFSGKMLQHTILGEGVDNEPFSAFAGHIYGFCYVLRCGFSTAIFPKGKEGISLENQNIFVILVV